MHQKASTRRAPESGTSLAAKAAGFEMFVLLCLDGRGGGGWSRVRVSEIFFRGSRTFFRRGLVVATYGRYKGLVRVRTFVKVLAFIRWGLVFELFWVLGYCGFIG